MEKLLELKHVKQYFKTGHGKNKIITKAVDDVSFFIKKGETFGLVGESGCGKTTTGRSIIKLYDITDGEVYFKGTRISAGTVSLHKQIAELKRVKVDAKNSEEIKNKIASLKEEIRKAKKDNNPDRDLMTKMQMIFQDPIASLNPRMTVKEIIAEGLKINGEKDDKVITDKVNHVLKLVGLLPEHASRYPHEFSGGQRQRIGVARALILNPDLIIADEPISALDVSIQAQVINLLNDLKHNLGLTILFIAHDLSVVKYFSDRIAVMYYGKMVELADSDELFKNPLHPYTRSLLSAVPLPDPNYEKTRKRITYNPKDHQYPGEVQSLVEVSPNHFVYAYPSEVKMYQEQLKK